MSQLCLIALNMLNCPTCDVPLWCHKSLQTLSSTHSIPLALFPSLLYPTTSINCFVFWNCPPLPTLLFTNHLPIALSLITHMYLFIHSFVCLFSLYIKILQTCFYMYSILSLMSFNPLPRAYLPPEHTSTYKDSSTCTLLSLHTATEQQQQQQQ